MQAVMASPARSSAFWALLVLCALLLSAELFLLSRVFLSSDSAAHIAVSHGQRLRILRDGRIEGAAALPPAVATETAALQAAADAPPADEDAPHSEEHAVPAATAPAEQAPAPVSAPSALESFIAEAAEEDSEASEAFEASAEAEQPSPLDTESMVGEDKETLDAIPNEPKTAASLAAPNPALREVLPEGILPRKGAGTTPFAHYSRPFTPPAGKALIALVVADLGGVKAQTEAALALPEAVTLAFSPYARHTPAWLSSARNQGHESWLMLPAQPADYPASDGGPLSILREMDAASMQARLTKLMASAEAYSGLMLPVGDALSEDAEVLQRLWAALDARGLGLMASRYPETAAALGWFKAVDPAYAADGVLDSIITREAMQAEFEKLEARAKKHGKALGVIRGYPLSLAMAQEWLSSLPAKGFVLAPASAVVAGK